MKALIGDKATQIVDARAAGRFEGRDARPAPGPAHRAYPKLAQRAVRLAAQADGTLKPAAELRELFAKAGVDTAKPVVATCGSGVTAGVIALALAHAGAARCRRLRRLLGGVGRGGQRPARRHGTGDVAERHSGEGRNPCTIPLALVR